MRRLPHRRRSILLECYALHEEIRTYYIVDNGMVDIGGELDCHYQYQFRRGAIDLVRHYVMEGRLCTKCISDCFDVLGSERPFSSLQTYCVRSCTYLNR